MLFIVFHIDGVCCCRGYLEARDGVREGVAAGDLQHHVAVGNVDHLQQEVALRHRRHHRPLHSARSYLIHVHVSCACTSLTTWRGILTHHNVHLHQRRRHEGQRRKDHPGGHFPQRPAATKSPRFNPEKKNCALIGRS